MRSLSGMVLVLVLSTACEITVVEPRYDYRDNIIGYYEAKEYSQTYNDYAYYSVRISKSGYDLREISFSNFYAADIRVYALLEFDKITIPMQVRDGYEIEGVGTVYPNRISLTYRVKDRYNNYRTDFCETSLYYQ